jgi:hypothetical protein
MHTFRVPLWLLCICFVTDSHDFTDKSVLAELLRKIQIRNPSEVLRSTGSVWHLPKQLSRSRCTFCSFAPHPVSAALNPVE